MILALYLEETENIQKKVVNKQQLKNLKANNKGFLYYNCLKN